MFRTILNPSASPKKIALNDSILSMGSCFSEMISEKLVLNKFNCCSNPFGIIFNPISLHRTIKWVLKEENPSESKTTTLSGAKVHFDAHSNMHAKNEIQLFDELHSRVNFTASRLQEANWLILTYGTAIVYTKDDEVVANCHKQPAGMFQKRLLTLKEMLANFEGLIQLLNKNYPQLTIIVTVSPVRHIKETLEINSVSKSLLRIFCHEISQQFSNVQYFPSYELLMDDLRDYRFYDRDLLHPNSTAEDYIWEKFQGAFFSEETQNTITRWNKLRKAIDHKPFFPESEDYKKFLLQTRNSLTELSSKLNVSNEISQLNNLLNDV